MGIALTISESVGAKSLTGKVAANKPEDVRRIQAMLNAACGRPLVAVTGRCDPGTIKAIRDFQTLWPTGTVDGRVDPDGTTLKRLNKTVTPLTLNPIKLGHVHKGCYLISYSGDIPPKGYQILLSLGIESKALNVTDRPKGDLINEKNISDFLKLLDSINLWAPNTVDCSLYVKRAGKTITHSNVQALQCPVKPYAGKLGRELLKQGTVEDFTYSGVNDGRFFLIPAINGKYYFIYDNKLEVDPKRRGLNCITYAGAIWGVDAYTGAMRDYGSQLATHLGGRPVTLKDENGKEKVMDAVKEDDCKRFFAANKKGTYLMFCETHTVVVADGVIHEFTNKSPEGYHQTDAQKWHYKPLGPDVFWIREITRPMPT